MEFNVNDISDKTSFAKLRHWGNFYFASYPTENGFKEFKDLGIEIVIDLKTPGEIPMDDKEHAKAAGLEYYNFPICGPSDLTKDKVDEIAKIIDANLGKKIAIYCMSANRVGSWFANHLYSKLELDIDAAVEAGIEVGMDKSPMIEGTIANINNL